MCKELKRLKLLSKCNHINKTDRDALLWVLQKVSPDEVDPEKGFDGWDFSSWPCVPSEKIFNELIKSRKAKKGVIMTQAYINSAGIHLHELVKGNLTVNDCLSVAALHGWQGFKAKWVANEVEQQRSEVASDEIKTPEQCIQLITQGYIKNIRDVPKHIRMLIETQYRIGNYSPDKMYALERIGLVI